MSDKLVQGFGINDVAYEVQKYEGVPRRRVWTCPYYRKWCDMLVRCYNNKRQEVFKTYHGCTVSEEFKHLSDFIRWVDSQPCRNWREKHLDKDFLLQGNKVYSPYTCVFLDGRTNSFITDCNASRGKLLIGVSPSKSNNKPFIAQCHDPLGRYPRYLGSYTTELEAHLAWKSCKQRYASDLAELEEDLRVKLILKDMYK